jgi:hypothetical protein
VQVVDQNHIDLVFQETTWKVQQQFFDDHIAAITANEFAVGWSIL